MASVASQIILHPALTATLKVASTTVGRDKVYRTVQYFARFLAFYCLRKGYSNELVARLQALKSALGMSRKLMRIGKPLEHAQAAIKALDVVDPVLRITALGRQIGYFGYLCGDMLNWAHSTKVRPFTPTVIAKINRVSAQLWFTGICFSLISSTYKLRALASKEAKLRKVGASEKESERREAMRAVKTQRGAVRYQLIQDSLDICLPAGSLNFHSLDDGALGLIGFASSLMGLRTQVGKVLGTK